MGKIENDELRKIKNAHFMRAFDYLKEKLHMGQGELAEAIGSKSAYISNFKKGLRPIPDETIARLIELSAKHPGLHLYDEYLYGNSDYMLLDHVPDEEITAVERRRSNPDYDLQQKRLADAEKKLDAEIIAAQSAIGYPVPGNSHTDHSSLMNAVIAAKDEAILALKRELEAKNALIASLQNDLAGRDDHIATLKGRLIEYRKVIDSRSDPLQNYPFHIGTADNAATEKPI